MLGGSARASRAGFKKIQPAALDLDATCSIESDARIHLCHALRVRVRVLKDFAQPRIIFLWIVLQAATSVPSVRRHRHRNAR
jgi:hypothetical protein